jgi:hypothetical protein
MMMVIYSEFPLLGKMFSCLRCRVVTVVAKSGAPWLTGMISQWSGRGHGFDSGLLRSRSERTRLVVGGEEYNTRANAPSRGSYGI